MRLASYRDAGGKIGYGAVIDDRIIPLSDRVGIPSLAEAVGQMDRLDDAIRHRTGDGISFDDLEWLPPIAASSKIFCVGRNFRSAMARLGLEAGKYPILFARFASSIVGHRQAIVRPAVSNNFDYEGELAVVIGKRARNVGAENALDVVAGYTCFNDGSIRDYQRHTSQDTPGKNFWRSGAMGPWLVARKGIANPAALELTTRVNGRVVQASSLDDMYFSVEEVVAYISSFTLLEPGDVIVMGTPYGVGLNAEPPAWLEPGDQVDVSISHIGTLSNPVVGDGVPE